MLVDLICDTWQTQAIGLQVRLQKFCSYVLETFVCLHLILVILLLRVVIRNISLHKALFLPSFQNCH